MSDNNDTELTVPDLATYAREAMGRAASVAPCALRDDVALLGQAALALIDENERLLADNEHIRKVLAREAAPRFGPFYEHDKGGVAVEIHDPLKIGQQICGRLAAMLDHIGAANYIETTFTPHDHADRDECLTVTVQRWGKVTPTAARKEAETHLARAVALLSANGIPWDGPMTFDPPKPPEREKPDATPWVRIDCSEDPNLIRCERCGATQDLPREHSGDMLKGIADAFIPAHRDCREGDAERLRELRGGR